MRSIKTIIKGAAHRIKESCTMFGRRVAIALGTFTFAVSEAMAGSKGAAGFTKATQEISSYETPVSNLMKAIAAVIVLVGAFNVYFKLQTGDPDVKKTIMLTIVSRSSHCPLRYCYFSNKRHPKIQTWQ